MNGQRSNRRIIVDEKKKRGVCVCVFGCAANTPTGRRQEKTNGNQKQWEHGGWWCWWVVPSYTFASLFHVLLHNRAGYFHGNI